MKKIKNYFPSLLLLISMTLNTAFAQNTFSSIGSSVNADLVPTTDNRANPGSAVTYPKDASVDQGISHHMSAHLNFTVTIPDVWQSQIVRVDYENESIFSLKTGDKSPAFLFSVTKITSDQWMKVKNQISGYTIMGNKEGFITFVQRTGVKKMQTEVDAMIGSIRLK